MQPIWTDLASESLSSDTHTTLMLPSLAGNDCSDTMKRLTLLVDVPTHLQLLLYSSLLDQRFDGTENGQVFAYAQQTWVLCRSFSCRSAGVRELIHPDVATDPT